MTPDLNTSLWLVALALFFVFVALQAFHFDGAPAWLVRCVRWSRVFRVIVRRNHSLRRWVLIVWVMFMASNLGAVFARSFV